MSENISERILPPRKRMNEEVSLQGNLTGMPRRNLKQNEEEISFNKTSNLNFKEHKKEEKIPSFLDSSIRFSRKGSNNSNNEIFMSNDSNTFNNNRKIPILNENTNIRVSTSSSNENSLRNSKVKKKLKNSNLVNFGLASALGGLVTNEENSKKKAEL